MLTDADGNMVESIALTERATKGRSGRNIHLNKELKLALHELQTTNQTVGRVIRSQRSKSVAAQTIINMFRGWYLGLGMEGCSSHSGRRTFTTKAARKVGQTGGSIRDVNASGSFKPSHDSALYRDRLGSTSQAGELDLTLDRTHDPAVFCLRLRIAPDVRTTITPIIPPKTIDMARIKELFRL